jgi:hypothetical protein
MKRSGIFGFVTDEIVITPHTGKIFEERRMLQENGNPHFGKYLASWILKT